MNYKNLSLAFIITALFLGSIFAVYTYQQQKINQLANQVPTPKTSQTLKIPISSPDLIVDPTSEWLTFKSDKYGFEFKYPDKYIVSNLSQYPKSFFLDEVKIIFAPGGEGPMGQMAIHIKTDSITNLINTYKNDYKYSNFIEKEIPVGGLSAKFISGKVEAESYITGQIDTHVFVSFDDKTFNINHVYNPEYKDGISQDLFIQILSTFNFIDTDIQTGNWNTVFIPRYDFSFIIPKGWGIVYNMMNGEFVPITQDQTFTWGFNLIQIKKSASSNNLIQIDLTRQSDPYITKIGSEPEFDKIFSNFIFAQ